MRTLPLLALLLLVGCGPTKEVMYHDDPLNPTRVTRTELVEDSFFKSENLAEHYSAIRSQTQALIGLHEKNPYETKTEQVLGGIVTAMLVERVSLAPAPRTMADVFNSNLTAWLSLGLQAYQVFDGNLGKRTGSPNLSIEGDGNNLLFDSQLGTGTGSRAEFYLGDYSPIDADSTGHASSLVLDASRPYQYNYDASRQTTQTWTDSPQDDDWSLF
jgi:hypothetical protein